MADGTKKETSVADAEGSGSKKDYLLPVSVLIAGIMISASVLYSTGNKNSQPNAAGGTTGPGGLAALNAPNVSGLNLSNRDVVLGDAKAQITFIEYGDYQCPFCARFFGQTEPLLIKDYVNTGKVKFVFRNFQFLGSESFAAAEAAECAKDQGKFWAYHDALYSAEETDGRENNGNLNRDLFLKLASDLKLEGSAFAKCIDGKKYADQIKQDSAAAQSVGVDSTPISFVNGQKIQGALPYEQFKTIIDNVLNKK